MCEVKPFGPHQCSRRSGSVSAFHTSSRGASKTRVTISAQSVDWRLYYFLRPFRCSFFFGSVLCSSHR